MSAEDELEQLKKEAVSAYGHLTIEVLTDLLFLAERQLGEYKERSSPKLPQCEHNLVLLQLAWGSKLPKSD